MPQKNLTAKEVENSRVESGEKLLADGDCLFLRVRPESKTWLFIYRSGGGRPKLSLGQFPTVTLADVRGKADMLRKQLAEGIDPQDERKRVSIEKQTQKALQEALPQTVKDLFDLWQKKALKSRLENGKRRGRKDNGEETRRKFEKDVFPTIGSLPNTAIRRAHVIQILDKVKDRGALRIAGILLTDLRQMFAFAVDREILETDPLAGMTRAKHGGMANERERVLDETEIKQLATAAPKALGEVQQRAIWIMLGTACRISEITNARWEHVDLEVRTWLIPKTKNGKPHTVTLSGFMLSQFKALKEYAEAEANRTEKAVSPWCMPARHHDGCVCSKSIAKQIADRQRGNDKEPMSRRSPLVDALILPGGKWVPHDLRRTAATIMASLNIRPDVIEKCLNHADDNRVRRTYNRHSYAPEMADAWRLLGERIELLTRGDGNVVTLHKSKERGKAA